MRYNAHFGMLPERAFRSIGGRMTYEGGGSGGGGNSQPTNSTVTQSSIPDWMRPQYEQLMGQSSALTDINNNPYQSYQGNRIAAFDPLQSQAFGDLQGQGMLPQQTLDASNNASSVAAQAEGYQGYQPGQFQNQYFNPNFQQMGVGSLNVGTGQFTDPGVAEGYMSPYIQNAVNPVLDQMQRQSDIRQRNLSGQAQQAGAFGGYRHDLQLAEEQRNTERAMGDTAAQMYNQGYGIAGQLYGTDATRGLQAGTANQGANLQAQGLGMQQNLAGNQFNLAGAQNFANFGNLAQQQAEQSRQFGGNLGLQGLNTSLQGSGLLGQMGQQQYAQQMGLNQAQQLAGAQLQGQEQTNLNNQYQDFLSQQNWPYKNLSFMSGILGQPTMNSAQSMYQAPASTSQNLMGLGLGAYGLSNMFRGPGGKKGGMVKAAGGGQIRGYANGGGIGGLTPQQYGFRDFLHPRSGSNSNYGFNPVGDPIVRSLTPFVPFLPTLPEPAGTTEAPQPTIFEDAARRAPPLMDAAGGADSPSGDPGGVEGPGGPPAGFGDGPPGISGVDGPAGVGDAPGDGTGSDSGTGGTGGAEAKGGLIRRYALGGGIMGTLPDQRLQRYMQGPPSFNSLAAGNEMQNRGRMRTAAQYSPPMPGAPQQPNPMSQGLAGMGADPMMGFKDGGIVGYAKGGETYEEDPATKEWRGTLGRGETPLTATIRKAREEAEGSIDSPVWGTLKNMPGVALDAALNYNPLTLLQKGVKGAWDFASPAFKGKTRAEILAEAKGARRNDVSDVVDPLAITSVPEDIETVLPATPKAKRTGIASVPAAAPAAAPTSGIGAFVPTAEPSRADLRRMFLENKEDAKNPEVARLFAKMEGIDDELMGEQKKAHKRSQGAVLAEAGFGMLKPGQGNFWGALGNAGTTLSKGLGSLEQANIAAQREDLKVRKATALARVALEKGDDDTARGLMKDAAAARDRADTLRAMLRGQDVTAATSREVGAGHDAAARYAADRGFEGRKLAAGSYREAAQEHRDQSFVTAQMQKKTSEILKSLESDPKWIGKTTEQKQAEAMRIALASARKQYKGTRYEETVDLIATGYVADKPRHRGSLLDE